MKNIKYYFVICLITLLSSCSSSDDDSGEANNDTIIGKWQIDQRFNDGVEESLSDCFKTTTIEFTADNRFISTLMDISTSTNNCEVALVRNATWTKISDGVYDITFTDGPSSGTTVQYTYVFENNDRMSRDDEILSIKTYYTRL